jgi:hypothetical protein
VNKRFIADFDDETDEEVYKQHKPRQLAAEHRVKKMRQEKDDGRKKRQPRRRLD